MNYDKFRLDTPNKSLLNIIDNDESKTFIRKEATNEYYASLRQQFLNQQQVMQERVRNRAKKEKTDLNNSIQNYEIWKKRSKTESTEQKQHYKDVLFMQMAEKINNTPKAIESVTLPGIRNSFQAQVAKHNLDIDFSEIQKIADNEINSRIGRGGMNVLRR